LGGYLGDDVDLQASEGGGNSASTSRDERDAEDRPNSRALKAAAGGGGGGGPPPSPGQTLPRTFSQERRGLQKYVSLSADAAALAQSGTASAGIAHLQGLQPPAAETMLAPSTGAGPNKGGLATTSTGLAALARAGKLFNTNCVFDLEVRSVVVQFTLSTLHYHACYVALMFAAWIQVIGPDEKALIAVGDSWEWASNKRLLQNVTEASLYHMKRATIISRFGSSQLASLPALKCMRFVFNDFSSLKNVRMRFS